MYIDQVIYPVESLGPGKRIGIWTVGCSRKCPGCSNPELWSTADHHSVPVGTLVNIIAAICNENQVDGFTITGGEPMDQAEELLVLVENLAAINPDILIFSGYLYEQLVQTDHTASVLDFISVLVDGEYIRDKNEQLVLRGSSNQRILLFEPSLEAKYITYLKQGRSNIQNYHFSDETISIGIHEKMFSDILPLKLLECGIRSVKHGRDEMAQRTGYIPEN